MISLSFLVLLIFLFSSKDEKGKSVKNSPYKAAQSANKIGVLPEISRFLEVHKKFGTPISVESVPNWMQGKRQRVTLNINGNRRNLLFYTKDENVVTIYEDGAGGRKKVWGEFQKSEKFAPVDRKSSTSLPAYKVLYSNKMVSSRKFGDILIPSFSRQTPVTQRESTFRAIAKKEGLHNISFYSIENAYKANVSASFAKSHPNAMRNGFLGMIQGGKFIAGETLYP